MKKILIWIGTVIGAAALLTLGIEYFSTFNQRGTITVSGECIAHAPKDRTAITLRVQTLDKSAAVSMKYASAKITEITNFLKTQDVEMQTTRFDSYAKTEWDNKLKKSVELGIETIIAMEVSAKEIETIESVLAKLVGLTDVYSENLRMFTSNEKMKPIIEKCLGAAVKNARGRATAIAKAEDKKVGKLVSAKYINTGNNKPRPMNMLRSAKSESVSFAGGIVSKDTEAIINIDAVFEIK